MSKVRLTIAACVLAVAPSAARACNVSSMPFWIGTDAQGTMTVRSGQPCPGSISMGTGGRDTQGPQQMDSLTLSTPPRNGTVTVTGNRWLYQSKPGFRGTDSFTLTLVGGPMFGTKMTTRMTRTVEVQ